MLLSRDDFLSILHTGKRMLVGKRVDYMASTFDVTDPIELKGTDGQEFLYTSHPAEGRDNLEGVPLF